MTDFNKVLTPGDFESGLINTVIEIPKGSFLKIEYNREKAFFELDRVEPSIFAKPCNYGFIPQTLDEDGDELDTLVLGHGEMPTGLVVRARVIAVMNFEDGGEADHKIVCAPEDDRDMGNDIINIEQISEQWRKQIEHHFNHYKDLKRPGTTKVLGWGDTEDAKKIIKECADRYKK